MTAPMPAGWYADPGGSTSLRWWDGQAWTAHLAAPTPPAPVATAVPFGAVPQQPFGYQPGAVPTAMQRQIQRQSNSVWQSSPHATRALVVTAIYVVIAIATPFGLIGIVPIVASIYSLQAGEKLAPAAVGAAVLAFAVGMLKVTHHL